MKTNIKTSLNGLEKYALCPSQLSKIKGGDDQVVAVVHNIVIEDTIDI